MKKHQFLIYLSDEELHALKQFYLSEMQHRNRPISLNKFLVEVAMRAVEQE